MATTAQLGTTLAQKRAEHAAWLAAHKNDDGQYDMSAEDVGQFNTRNDELDKLQQEYEQALKVEKSAAENEAKMAPQGRVVAPEVKDAGPPRLKTKDDLDAAFRKGIEANAPMHKHLASGGQGSFRFELPANLKTIVDIADITNENNFVGYAPYAISIGDVEDRLPHGVVSSNNVRYYIHNADTANAAFVANVTAGTDAVETWTLTTDEVEDMQAWVPVGRDILSDIPMLQSLLTGILAKNLQKVASAAMLVGTGTTPVIWGMFTRTNFQTQAKGTDPVFDAVHKGITKVRAIGAEPNLAVFHPNDWEGIRLTRTTEGIYLLGSPTDAGPMRIWGVPVVTSLGMTENTGGVVDTSYTMIFENGGLVVEFSTEHASYFTARTAAIAMSRRVAAAHFLPTAACTITGI